MAIGESDHPVGIYELRDEARKLATTLPPDQMFVEVGNYEGGSAKAIMEAIKDSGVDRWFITIDPYGSIPYKSQYDGYRDGEQSNYTDDTYRKAMAYLYTQAAEMGIKYTHYRMKSTDFAKIYDQAPLYEDGTPVPAKFGFVYLDGAHEGKVVAEEFAYFEKLLPQGTIVIDDWSWVLKSKHVKHITGEFTNDDRLYWRKHV